MMNIKRMICERIQAMTRIASDGHKMWKTSAILLLFSIQHKRKSFSMEEWKWEQKSLPHREPGLPFGSWEEGWNGLQMVKLTSWSFIASKAFPISLQMLVGERSSHTWLAGIAKPSLSVISPTETANGLRNSISGEWIGTKSPSASI